MLSGVIIDEVAVEVIRAAAHDYLLKDRTLSRLEIDALLLDLAMPGVPEREAARQRERRAHQRRQARSKEA
jgi:DNA-binding NarL/FixJ family response regulator